MLNAFIYDVTSLQDHLIQRAMSSSPVPPGRNDSTLLSGEQDRNDTRYVSQHLEDSEFKRGEE